MFVTYINFDRAKVIFSAICGDDGGLFHVHWFLLQFSITSPHAIPVILFMLRVKFDFRLILIEPRLILNFLCFLALIHE